jgi:hypothetical protein
VLRVGLRIGVSKGRVKGGKGVLMIYQRLRRCGNVDKTRLWRWDAVDKGGLDSGKKVEVG